MITILIFHFLNVFIFNFDMNTITENTRILILLICIASDLNLLTTIWRER